MQHVFGGDGLGANTALGKRDVRRDGRIQVVAHHDHVEQLGLRVDAVGQRRIRRARQHVRFSGDADDVRRVSAAGAFGVERVDRATFERCDRVFDETRFVQRVGVNRHLHFEVVGHRERGADHRGRRSPVFVAFESDRAGFDLLDERRAAMRVTLAEKSDVDRQSFRGAKHHPDVPRARGDRRRIRSIGGSDAAADERRHAVRKTSIDLLRRNEMNMRVDAAGRQRCNMFYLEGEIVRSSGSMAVFTAMLCPLGYLSVKRIQRPSALAAASVRLSARPTEYPASRSSTLWATCATLGRSRVPLRAAKPYFMPPP